MIRLCAFDLDGTLLGPDRKMSEANAAALRDLYRCGASVAIVTGRPPCYAEAYLLHAGVRGYVASSNGCRISRPDGSILYRNVFPPELVAEITSILGRRGSRFAVQFEHGITGNRPMDPAIADRFMRYRAMAYSLGMDVALPLTDPDIPGVPFRDVLKIAVTEDRLGIPDCLNELQDRFPHLSVTLSGPTVGDINLAGDDKGSALTRIARDLSLSRSEICCFGDYDNDVSMFAAAGLPVAMGNATLAARDAAAYVTKTNSEDGVADAIRGLVLPEYRDHPEVLI